MLTRIIPAGADRATVEPQRDRWPSFRDGRNGTGRRA